MAAVRRDLEWDRGGGWTRRFVRRARDRTIISWIAPAVMEIREIDAPSTTAPLLTLVGAMAPDRKWFDLALTEAQVAQVAAWPKDRYEYRLLTGANPPRVRMRGYLNLVDTVGGG